MNIFANPADVDVEQATSEDIPIGTVDFVKNLDIVDKIKSNKYTSKQACQAIKKRLAHKNPNVQLSALGLLDTLVKNCGLGFHIELCQKDIVDQLFLLTTQDKTRQKTLELVQFWALSFKSIME
jgi:growth factor-regulated tyrosine kinase substrate